jgi:hypothetical protein
MNHLNYPHSAARRFASQECVYNRQAGALLEFANSFFCLKGRHTQTHIPTPRAHAPLCHRPDPGEDFLQHSIPIPRLSPCACSLKALTAESNRIECKSIDRFLGKGECPGPLKEQPLGPKTLRSLGPPVAEAPDPSKHPLKLQVLSPLES